MAYAPMKGTLLRDRAWVRACGIELKEFRKIREFSEGLRAFRWGLREIKEFKEFRESLRAFRTHSAPEDRAKGI